MQIHEGELDRASDGDEQVEPPFDSMNLGQINVEVAERVGVAERPLRFINVDLWQSADVAAQAAV